MVKAAREAKVRTSWLDPDAEFESALTGYIEAALDPAQSGRFLEDVAAFAERIAPEAGRRGARAPQIELDAPVQVHDILRIIVLVLFCSRRTFPTCLGKILSIMDEYG